MINNARTHRHALHRAQRGGARRAQLQSRRFSTANIKLKIAAADLNRALPLLQELRKEAVPLLPGLLEPWQVISESGVIGQ